MFIVFLSSFTYIQSQQAGVGCPRRKTVKEKTMLKTVTQITTIGATAAFTFALVIAVFDAATRGLMAI